MLASKDAGVEKAVCVLAELSQDEEERLLAESREKAYRDWQASMEGSFSDGMEKGIEKGEIKGKIDDAIILISKYHFSLNSVIKDFGLNDECKTQIIDELNKRNIKYTE